MRVSELLTVLNGGDNDPKIELLSHMSDIFESYNKQITNLEEIIGILMQAAIHEKDYTVREEAFEAILKASIFQNISGIDLSILVDSLNNLPAEHLKVALEIVGFSHNKNYARVLKRYVLCEDKDIALTAQLALREIGE